MTGLGSRFAPQLSILSVVFLTGCAASSGLLGVPSSGPVSPGGPPPLPSTDAGLAEHVPQQVVIGLLPATEPQKVIATVNGKVLNQNKNLNAVVISLPPGSSIVEAIRKFQGIPGVRYAEPNYIYRALLIPNDPFFATKQWGPQKINAPAAWDTTTGSLSSIIAILDTGITSAHPKFSGKILAGGTNCTPDIGGVEDANGHGTHVAGIAAATGNTGVGIAGMAWVSPILPIKVVDSTGRADSFWVACGIDAGRIYAIANPTTRVVENLSLGGEGYAIVMKDAIDAAIQNNVLIVAASGNTGKATILFPAGYPGVMAVGATTPTNDRAAFSSYGSYLSVVAPGVDIYSTWLGGGYIFLSGTSMAAPHVSGVAALVRGLNQGLTPAQVRAQIEQTATRLSPSGFDPQFGWGLVNAAAAVGPAGSSSYGSIQVQACTVSCAPGQLPPTSGADVIVWTGTPACAGLNQVVQTALTNVAGVAFFGTVPAGSYCVTVSRLLSFIQRGQTPTPFAVTAGATTSITIAVNAQ
jgi:thermitase